MKDDTLLQQEANSGSTWGWLFLVKSQEQQVRLLDLLFVAVD